MLKGIFSRQAHQQSTEVSHIDGDGAAARPYPVIIEKYDRDKNAVKVRRAQDAHAISKWVAFDYTTLQAAAENPERGMLAYFYPRSFHGNKGGAIRLGHDTEAMMEVRNLGGLAYMPPA